MGRYTKHVVQGNSSRRQKKIDQQKIGLFHGNMVEILEKINSIKKRMDSPNANKIVLLNILIQE